MPKERERENEERKTERYKAKYRDTGGVASPSFSSYGGTRLDPFQGYPGSHAKPHETRVQVSVRAGGLPRATGCRAPHAHGKKCVTPGFKAKTRCSSHVCSGSSCHTYDQNVSTEYQYLYYIVSYYKNLLQVQKGLNNGIDLILPQAVDRGFRTPRRSLHQRTPHLLRSRA
jgi:hypothetical protein